MRVYRSIEDARRGEWRRVVATLGVFDGVHVGHRLLLDQVVSLARQRMGNAVVVTFTRHPRAVIANQEPLLLTNLPHRLRIFANLGVDATIALSFDESLRGMEPGEFASMLFCDTLHADAVVLGYNNRFGRDGRGDFEVLRRVGARCGFEAILAREVRLGNTAVSSTAIRDLIQQGMLREASLMLGRPVSVFGTVVAGDGLGRKLGFPTANLDLLGELSPPRGVYGCEAEVLGTRFPGLVNIGVRPTLAPEAGAAVAPAGHRVEVHLLHFDGDLYGQPMEVFFLHRIRDEMRFRGLDDLRARIREDQRQFEDWLEGRREGDGAGKGR